MQGCAGPRDECVGAEACASERQKPDAGLQKAVGQDGLDDGCKGFLSDVSRCVNMLPTDTGGQI